MKRMQKLNVTCFKSEVVNVLQFKTLKLMKRWNKKNSLSYLVNADMTVISKTCSVEETLKRKYYCMPPFISLNVGFMEALKKVHKNVMTLLQ